MSYFGLKAYNCLKWLDKRHCTFDTEKSGCYGTLYKAMIVLCRNIHFSHASLLRLVDTCEGATITAVLVGVLPRLLPVSVCLVLGVEYVVFCGVLWRYLSESSRSTFFVQQNVAQMKTPWNRKFNASQNYSHKYPSM